MAGPSRLPLYAIPAGLPVAPCLAGALLAEAEPPEALAAQLVVLPGRRAVASLTRAFLEAAGGRPLLLPRMVAVGDLEETGALDGLLAGDSPVPPPAMDPLARSLALAGFLARAGHASGSRALALAGELGAALDSLAIHGVPTQQLAAAAGTLGPALWERNLAILAAVRDQWPALAEAQGLADPVVRRERILDAVARAWRDTPPGGRVTLAGFSSAPPAVARLLAAGLRLPGGRVVLSGFDPGLGREGWETLRRLARDPDRRRAAELHPQYGILAILEACGAGPEDIRPFGGEDAVPAPRLALARQATAPAAVPAPALPAAPASLAEGLAVAEAETPAEEARLVALALREALETPGRTAALVTPSRTLARQVAAELLRFGLKVDDSAGLPLRLTVHGRLLAALAEAAATRFAPVPLVALVGHPLVADGAADSEDGRAMAQALDRALRGVRPPPGLAGVRDRLACDPHLSRWWTETVAPALAPLEAIGRQTVPLSSLAEGLAGAAGRLAGERLWAGAEGQALARVLETAGGHDLALAPQDWSPVVDALLASETIRPQFGQHPRLAILGLLEARFEAFDLLVLGGLNEGTWPAETGPDPWLPAGLRRRLGLPSPDARIGRQAADLLALAAGRGRLLLTRARRSEAGPESPSRFLVKLRVAAGGHLPAEERLLALARALDQPAAVRPAARPAPAPPAAARPRVLRASAADMLAADPFSFYAGTLLGLEPLEPLDADPGAADRGTAVHAILERWLGRGEDRAAATEEELRRLGGGPMAALIWRPRIEAMLDWAEAELLSARAGGWTPIAFETAGEMDLDGVLLKGKADRVDQHSDGRIRILDYKTGAVPPRARAVSGYALQLPALALLAAHGRLAGVPAALEAELLFLKLSGNARKPGEVIGRTWPWDLVTAETRLRRLAAAYLRGEAPFRAKVHPLFAEDYRMFDHFARLAEWFGREGGQAADG